MEVGEQICWFFWVDWSCASPAVFGAWAGWAQFAAVAGGVVIAILVPAYQRHCQVKDERGRREDLKRSMAEALIGHIARIRGEAQFFLRNTTPEQLPKLTPKVIPADIFVPAKDFDLFRTQIHLLGPVSNQVNLVLISCIGLRAFVEDVCRGVTVTQQNVDVRRSEATKIVEVANKVIEQLGPIAEFYPQN